MNQLSGNWYSSKKLPSCMYLRPWRSMKLNSQPYEYRYSTGSLLMPRCKFMMISMKVTVRLFKSYMIVID